MVWLSEISPWTLAAVGLGWVGVSGALALVLGKVLARTNKAAENEEVALEKARVAQTLSQPAVQFEPTNDWFAQSSAMEDGDGADSDEYAGRAASGTHFKAVHPEVEPKESAANNQQPLRRIR